MIELEAILKGIDVAIEIGARKLWVESDSLRAVQAIIGVEHGPWYSLNIIEEIRERMGLFENVRISHIYREANVVADRLASFSVDPNVFHVLDPPLSHELNMYIISDRDGKLYLRS
ncbi:hypothetical protein ACHQM5_009755 [Ranunculus cassubicifolius]